MNTSNYQINPHGMSVFGLPRRGQVLGTLAFGPSLGNDHCGFIIGLMIRFATATTGNRTGAGQKSDSGKVCALDRSAMAARYIEIGPNIFIQWSPWLARIDAIITQSSAKEPYISAKRAQYFRSRALYISARETYISVAVAVASSNRCIYTHTHTHIYIYTYIYT